MIPTISHSYLEVIPDNNSYNWRFEDLLIEVQGEVMNFYPDFATVYIYLLGLRITRHFEYITINISHPIMCYEEYIDFYLGNLIISFIEGLSQPTLIWKGNEVNSVWIENYIRRMNKLKVFW
jgi:hypothetical protein